MYIVSMGCFVLQDWQQMDHDNFIELLVKNLGMQMKDAIFFYMGLGIQELESFLKGGLPDEWEDSICVSYSTISVPIMAQT